MLYYRYWMDKDCDWQIRKTDKAIGLEISQNTWIHHNDRMRYLWIAKSQIIIEDGEWKDGQKIVNYYIPAWIIKKNHLEYSSFEIGTIHGKENYEVER